tara:strand:- start:35 stop:484 length:450 start_codon:yes stop_codon:yes gene_type:complete
MSRWLFFPSPASSAPRLAITGSIGSTNATVTRYNIDSWAKSGDDDADYLEYSFFPIRNNSTSVSLIVLINASGTWANVGAWKAAITVDSSTSSLSIGGVVLAHTTVTALGSDSGTAASIVFNASSGTISTFWNTISTSDALDMTFNYTT